jgi:putative ABC transport system permease protein
MRPVSLAKSFFRSIFRRQQIDADLDAEVRSTVDLLADQKMEEGMSPEAARRAARIELGGVEQVKEAVRSGRAAAWLDNVFQDLRFALRILRKAPGFTAVAVLTLALGIGATAAIFTVVNRFLLEPPPLPYPDREVELMQGYGPYWSIYISLPEYTMWRNQTRIIENAAVYQAPTPVNLLGGDHPQQVLERRATEDYFTLMGYRVAVGRAFTAKEDVPGAPPVAVISNDLWRRRFGSNPGMIGKDLDIDNTAYAVVGILAPRPPAAGATVDVYVPLQPDPNSANLGNSYLAFGRLKPGVAVTQADAALKLTTDQFRRKYPGVLDPRTTFRAETMRELETSGGKELLLVFLGAVGFVLLIACSNVANLVLARAAGRQREIAIRVALGSTRGRVIRQILTEGVLLSLVGGAIGLALAYAGLRALLVFIGSQYHIGRYGQSLTLDWRVLLFALGISALAGALAGLVPAIKASHTNLAATMNEGGSRTGSGIKHNKTRSLLVVVEMALAMVLLAGAGLLIRTFLHLRGVNPGFETRNILTMDMSLGAARFAKTAAVETVVREGQQRLDSLPGVRVAAASGCLPFQACTDLPFNIEGRAPTEGRWSGGGQWRRVSPGYFRAFRIPLLRGRAFTVNDSGSSQPVVIINEAMAKQFWPKGGELGTRITIGKGVGPQFADLPREIVGVVGNVRDNGLNYNPVPTMYVPVAQLPDELNAGMNAGLPLTWIIRTRVAPPSLSHDIQQQLRIASGGLPVGRVRTMDQVVAHSIVPYSIVTTLLLIFAGLALLLAAVGIYGVIAYSVAQRTHEIGIRMALGASRERVRRTIAAQGMTLVLVGMTIGIAGGLGLTWLLRSLLFGVKPWDPLAFVAATVALLLAALLGCTVPAFRASRVDPMVALRHE